MANSSANSSTETTNAVQGAKVPVTLALVLLRFGNFIWCFALKSCFGQKGCSHVWQ
jgi:hypothetical protein